MSARRIVLACAVGLAAVAPSAATAAPASATTPAPQQARIAKGVKAGGIDLSHLTVTQATNRLHADLDKHLARPIALEVRGRTFRLSMEKANFAFDAEQTAENALAVGAGATKQEANVPLVVSHHTTPVRAFLSSVAKRVRSSPRSATLRITVKHMVKRRAKYGYRLDQKVAYEMVNRALDDASAARKLRKKLTRIRPRTNTLDLARRYRTVITVQKSTRTLRLFKNLKIAKRYKVAIGQPAYPTPAGLFSIQSKQVNPVWSVPNSPWAGELGGTTVQGGTAANPLKARWMGIVNGVGFHGTGDDASVGTAASHGCLRMHVRDVIALYKRVPVGTPVLISNS